MKSWNLQRLNPLQRLPLHLDLKQKLINLFWLFSWQFHVPFKHLLWEAGWLWKPRPCLFFRTKLHQNFSRSTINWRQNRPKHCVRAKGEDCPAQNVQISEGPSTIVQLSVEADKGMLPNLHPKPMLQLAYFICQVALLQPYLPLW